MGYFGSKAASGAYRAIIAQMPPHDTYIETHLGSGIVISAKPPALRSFGIDLNGDALAAFKCSYPVELHQGDAVQFLRHFDFATAGRVLIYADPPYLHETRLSNTRYAHEYTTKDHKTLIATLRAVPASVILSGYPSRLYQQLLPDWRSIEFQVMTHGGVRTEKVWLNFPAQAAHWATFAGVNCVDRQRIKRKAERWATNYRGLPPAEQVAILAAILETHQRGELP